MCTINVDVARGCIRRVEKEILGAKFTGESYKCIPGQSKSPIFEDIFAGCGRFGGWEWLI